MPRRNEVERDFTLKSTIRAILWSQGYSTRLDVLLAYDKASQGKAGSGKIALTDPHVLGMRLDPGFRIHTVVAAPKPHLVKFLKGFSGSQGWVNFLDQIAICLFDHSQYQIMHRPLPESV